MSRGSRRQKDVENVPGYVFALSTVALAFVRTRVGVLLQAEYGLPALCDDLRCGHCALHHLGWCDDISYDFIARRASSDVARLIKSPLGLASVAGLALGTLALLNAFPREAHAADFRRGDNVRSVCVCRARRAGAGAHGSAEDGLPAWA